MTADPSASSGQALPGPPLRLAVLGDFDGLHTRRWVEFFVKRGHEVHAISFYEPQPLPGVNVHVLKPGLQVGVTGWTETPPFLLWPPCMPAITWHLRSQTERRLPSLLRLVHALRYQRAGLNRTLRAIKPDVFHAHYVVEHGFYGALTGFHPYVVSAWGSDLFVAPKTPLGNAIARFAVGRADLVTANDPQLAVRAAGLGVRRERLAVIRLGIDRLYFDAPPSVNLDAASSATPTIISDRALEPLYNVDVVFRAFSRLRERLPAARLLVAGHGNQMPQLIALRADLGEDKAVQFLGQLDAPALRDRLASAHVYVSVPDSDSMSLSTMEAMAVGAFPVVSDLPSQDWIVHGVNGLRVPPRDIEALADALYDALTNAELRRNAVAINRAKVEAEGSREKNMLLMERHYYRLAGHPVDPDSA